MLKEIDEHLVQLAGLIVSFLQTVDEEDELYFLVEKLCDYDEEIMDKLSFAINCHLTEREVGNIVPSGSEYAH